MSRRLLLGIVVAALALAAVAIAQPPGGVVRPENEGSLRPLELGAQLFAANCASCHGPRGQGVYPPPFQHGASGIKGAGPSLLGVGALAVDFYVRTGYMPLGDPTREPHTNRDLWNARERRALVAYVASLSKGPPVPHPDPAAGRLSEGLQLFTERCSGCHQVAGEGGVVTGARVPPIQHVAPQEIAEAVRTGPFVMPAFSQKDISDSQLNSIIAYVRSAGRHDSGGWGIGHVGPIPEGMVTWFIAVVVLIAVCVVLGTRLKAR
ncbi:MAG: c-type cytochrome [Actinobacteria bacterium]|nr:MAG: c-type cytochrome [Actinomycetota bacterium]